MRRILLVEPAYKNKYPPMGLMKISTYHKMIGDYVHFVKGKDVKAAQEIWDRIYVTTLFTFDFDICVDTISFYMRVADSIDDVFSGGIMASLMPDKLSEATGLPRKQILTGLFTDTTVVGDDNDINVDQLPLDYDILEEIDYKYPAGDNYFGYTTRGCPNHCKFCAVPILEPQFQITNNIVKQIRCIDQKYGPKRHLLLLDNNVLNRPNLKELVDDLCLAGFAKGAKYEDPGDYNIIVMRYRHGDRGEFLDSKLKKYLSNFKKRIKSQVILEEFINLILGSEEAESFPEYILDHDAEFSPIIERYRNKAKKARYLDFNQGVDARKINDQNMSQLARLAIKPLRIAFDDIALEKIYCNAVRTAHRHGISEISNYILFNYRDKPEDLYNRLKVNIDLNRELGINIFSFPMKYSPVNMTDRKYIGEKWTKKQLRAISAILQVTKGVVAAGSDFFFKAFGSSIEEYLEILAMPRDMIMFRSHFEENGLTREWQVLYRQLSLEEKQKLLEITSLSKKEMQSVDCPIFLRPILPYYLIHYTGTSKEERGKEEKKKEEYYQTSIFDDTPFYD